MTLSSHDPAMTPLWRDRALSRSLASVRERSDAKLQRLLDAARQVIMESPDSDLTVSEVAAHSGISLKTLYTWFSSKDELLLALLEEECRLGAVMLTQGFAPYTSPVERLEHCAEVVFQLAEYAPDYARFIYRQHQRLSVEHRPEVTAALSPMVEVVEQEIRKAMSEGLAEPGDAQVAARLVFALLIDGLSVCSSSPGRVDPEVAEVIDDFIIRGLVLRGPASEASTSRLPRRSDAPDESLGDPEGPPRSEITKESHHVR